MKRLRQVRVKAGLARWWVSVCQRWQVHGYEDRRQCVLKHPANKLSELDRQAIIETCNNEEFRSQSPKQIVPSLADRGRYLALESTFYRILRAEDLMHRRGHTRQPTTVQKPAPSVARGQNQVWSWDITYLASSVKGMFFTCTCLWISTAGRLLAGKSLRTSRQSMLDRCYAKYALAKAIVAGQAITLHSDNGSPMKGATLLATMQKLGVMPSFSRPAVRNDNVYSESLFKTIKYVPGYPAKPFENIERTTSSGLSSLYTGTTMNIVIAASNMLHQYNGMMAEILKYWRTGKSL